ncbi:MAG: hypothetical protein U5N55_04880 [Cypionkella sp.]|nr:hypothetical protein [Cypionkella sp.]
MGIRDLTQATAIASGDQVPMWSQGGGDDQRISVTQLTTYMQNALSFTAAKPVAQFAAPTNGQTVTVTKGDTWLTVTPAGTLAALTISLPSDRTDGEAVLVNCTQIITALTINGAGAAVAGAPTTLAAENGFFEMRYSSVLNSWFRTG